MAENITITANTTQAQASIERLNRSAERLGQTFGGLAGALAGLVTGAALRNAIAFADTLDDMSKATGIAINNIQGLSTAFTANGGTAEGAQKAILELVKELDAARSGSGRTQAAFEDVGVSLQDLARLSEQDILAKTIQGLAKVTDASKRVTLAQQLLGKEARTVDFAGVAQDYGRASQEALRYTQSVQEAARLQGQLDTAFKQLQMSILKAVEPLAKFINSLDPETIQRFVDAVVKIGGAAAAIGGVAAAFSALGRIIAALSVAGAGLFALFARGGQLIAGGAAVASGAFSSLSRTLQFAWGYIDRFIRGTPMFSKDLPLAERLGTLMTKLGERVNWLQVGLGLAAAGAALFVGGLAKVAAGLAAIVGITIAANEAAKLLFDVDPIDIFARKLENLVTSTFPSLAAGINKLGERLGMGPAPSQRDEQQRQAAQERFRRSEQQAIATQVQAVNEVKTKVDELKAKLREVTDEYRRGGELLVRNIEFETSLVGKTEAEVAVARAVNQERERAQQALQGMAKQEADIAEQLRKGEISRQVAANMVGAVRAASAKITEESQRTQTAVVAATKAYQDRLAAQRIEQLQLQAILDQQEQLVEYHREMAQFQDQINAARLQAISQVEQLKQENALTEQREALEQAIRNLRREDQDSARALFELENRRREQLERIRQIQDLPYDERVRKEREINQEIDRARTVIMQRSQAFQAEQSSFASGWQNALENFRNNIQTEAQLAGEIFGQFTRGLEDAFVNFAKTGKLSFKDMINSILQTLIRSGIQRIIAQTFGGFSFGSLFGGGGGGGFGTGNLFGNMDLGGFLASGGPARANVPYVVGEQGPELFVPNTAGTVVPNGGGATSVTYNINAVDAESFRSLVARDPEFLFAVTEQGRRRLPNQRR